MEGIAGSHDSVSIGPVDSSILLDEEPDSARCIDDPRIHTQGFGFDPNRPSFEEDALGASEMSQQSLECRARRGVRGTRGEGPFDRDVRRCRDELRADLVTRGRSGEAATKRCALSVVLDRPRHSKITGALFELVDDLAPTLSLGWQALARLFRLTKCDHAGRHMLARVFDARTAAFPFFVFRTERDLRSNQSTPCRDTQGDLEIALFLDADGVGASELNATRPDLPRAGFLNRLKNRLHGIQGSELSLR